MVDAGLTTDLLYPMFQNIRGEKQIPPDWWKDIMKISKKGDLSKCNNYRGIMLLSIPAKKKHFSEVY